MNEELAMKVKYLRLQGLLAHWNEYLKLAAEKGFSHGRLMTHIIEEEYRLKRENARTFRENRAQIPEKFVMETFPFQRQPKLNKKKILALYDALDYMRKNQNIIWLGPTGCGKTGLATSFLIHAINQGYNGRYILFAKLIGELYNSVADHSEEKVIKQYLSYDCLLIDELGYIDIEPVQVGLFFTLMQRRHKQKTTLFTSNLGFSEWGSFLKNAHLTAALIDRLTEVSHVFNMKNCVSLRDSLEPTKDVSKPS
jgi:DNA replication protein DnaC